jgi:hypothetical protein
MSTTIRDASLTTARKRQITLYGFRRSVGLYANPTTAKSEQAPSNSQGNGPTSDVNLSVFVGAQVIGQTAGACPDCAGATTAGFSKNSPATCNQTNNA